MSAFAYKTLMGCLSGPFVAIESYRGLLLLSLAVSYGYSSFVLGWRLQLLVTSQPAQIVVALLGLALFPTARARLSSNSSSSSGCDYSKGDAAGEASSMDSAAADGSALAAVDGSTVRLLSTPSIRLARPPFAADLSCGASPSYSSSSTPSSSGSKARRRRFPRVSIELTPLPRLSLEFQVKSNSRRSGSISGSRASLDDCMLYSPGSSSGGGSSSSRWQPSMSRIRSGHDLQLLSADGGDAAGQLSSVWPAGMSLQDAPTTGEATESLGHGQLLDGLQQIEQDITETHLLQVGAMLGEASSRAALLAQEAGGPVGHPGSFYGSADSEGFLEPWELLVCESSSSSVLYWAWRRPLRKGLYMYMTRSVFLGASPAELRAFMNDDAYRVVWDGAMNVLRPIAGPAAAAAAAGSNESLEAMAAAVAARLAGVAAPGTTAAAAAEEESCSGADSSSTLASASSLLSPFAALAGSSGSSDASAADEASSSSSSSGSKQREVLLHESGIMQALVHFPKPMASRSYIYARRVWHRPSDGGCYCLSKACGFEAPPALPCRAVSVEDYVAGCVVRAPAAQLLPPGCDGPAAEVLLVYFEDSHVRPGLANLGIKKGLWPLVQKTDKALRQVPAAAAMLG
ncbi:hypothetical protein OEZ85_003628 [Tetradesmus obliquus]|uniref:START domain-containing protein n=1 Tax=Tetradesmus obliquus TaxID=3088 RepID=A0ABY8UC73_TETOB|nr:hypothetical protein OEZ85_003628 [Tetradesmus obliquus]